MSRLRWWLTAACVLTSSACSQAVSVPCGAMYRFTRGPVSAKLSAWHLFTAHASALEPSRGVIPYDLNTPLFSDYSDKFRFVWMPPGTSARYVDDGPFEFPVGTVFAKTFAFPIGARSATGRPRDKLIETRLLVHAKTGWVALPYIWDNQQNDATLQLVPTRFP